MYKHVNLFRHLLRYDGPDVTLSHLHFSYMKCTFMYETRTMVLTSSKNAKKGPMFS